MKIFIEKPHFFFAKEEKKRNQYHILVGAGEHMKRCAMSLIIREMHIKTIHLAPIRMAKVKTDNSKC